MVKDLKQFMKKTTINKKLLFPKGVNEYEFFLKMMHLYFSSCKLGQNQIENRERMITKFPTHILKRWPPKLLEIGYVREGNLNRTSFYLLALTSLLKCENETGNFSYQ